MASMDKPEVYNAKHWSRLGTPPNSVYVGRPSKWGNPFVIDKDHTREDVLESYFDWLFQQPELLLCLREELRGKNLVCWCVPERCHADLLLELAND